MRGLILFIVWGLQFAVMASPVLVFENKSAIRFEKNLLVGEVEIIEFSNPVSLAHYGTTDQALSYIELEPLEPQKDGYRKFMVKAKAPGSGELSFESGKDLIKIKVIVNNDYQILQKELNRLFAPKEEPDSIQVISANINNTNDQHIYLQGKVNSAKEALLALSFAANALGDSGVKVYSNPGGQLRSKDLESIVETKRDSNTIDKADFVEFYESTNKLIDTDNLHRDLILASKNEKVISFIQIKEPKRFAVKVRFLEMNSQYVDKFISSLAMTSSGADIKGSIGTNSLQIPGIGSSSAISASSIIDTVSSRGITKLASELSSGNIASGVSKIFGNSFLNLNLNDLLQEGVLRIVNEFSLVTHSGDRVALGKGTRFPIPKLNNSVGNSSISVEYIPIGFKGELKVTGLESNLIDIQMASRLSSAESSVGTISGINIPIFNEEYVNSAALLKNNQEVVLNAFLTETETLAKSSTLLARLIPFLGTSLKKQKNKNLLFIAIKAEEITPSSSEELREDLHLPHIHIKETSGLVSDYSRSLSSNRTHGGINLGHINSVELKPAQASIDPLEIQIEDF